jgi:hypothetical protein
LGKKSYGQVFQKGAEILNFFVGALDCGGFPSKFSLQILPDIFTDGCASKRPKKISTFLKGGMGVEGGNPVCPQT